MRLLAWQTADNLPVSLQVWQGGLCSWDGTDLSSWAAWDHGAGWVQTHDRVYHRARVCGKTCAQWYITWSFPKILLAAKIIDFSRELENDTKSRRLFLSKAPPSFLLCFINTVFFWFVSGWTWFLFTRQFLLSSSTKCFCNLKLEREKCVHDFIPFHVPALVS